jgi:hypothetical protein
MYDSHTKSFTHFTKKIQRKKTSMNIELITERDKSMKQEVIGIYKCLGVFLFLFVFFVILLLYLKVKSAMLDIHINSTLGIKIFSNSMKQRVSVNAEGCALHLFTAAQPAGR